MSLNTPIEWTDATWNPTLGCSKISPGCKRCYAIRSVHRMAGNPNKKMNAANFGLTIIQNGQTNWTGKVRFVPDRLSLPLDRRKPTKFFVNSLSDLFHPQLPAEDIAEVFKVMYRAHWHTFQILTKHGETDDRLVEITKRVVATFGPMPPHIWIGVSVEDMKRKSRIGMLRRAPVSTRFLSVEPLLEDLGDLSEHLYVGPEGGREYAYTRRNQINWVIVGGESGPGARPMHPNWVRNILDQCQAAEVPFLFKQWGAWAPREYLDPAAHHAIRSDSGHVAPLNTGAERTSAGPIWQAIQRVGKKLAGRNLDGRTWDEMPEVRV